MAQARTAGPKHGRTFILDRSSRAAGGAVLTWDIRPSGLRRKNKEAPRASLSFMRTRDRARSLHEIRGYF